jgi:hypothetical protein
MFYIFIFLLVVFVIVGTPIAIIWALNTLFGLSIAYTFYTWLATLVLSGPFISSSYNSKD